MIVVLVDKTVNLASSHAGGVRACENARSGIFAALSTAVTSRASTSMRFAMRYLPLFAVLLCKAAFASSEPRNVGEFHAIEIDSSTPIAIDVQVGPAIRVEVSGDPDVVARVETRVRDGRLVVGTRDALHPQTKTHVTITVPRLDAVAITGIGSIDATGVTAPSFAVSIGGTGSIKLAGASDGAAYQIGGTGDIDAKNFALKTATVAMAGTGHLALTASDAVQIAVHGVGDVDVFGHPKSVSKSISGVGHVSLR
jgi:Putative auto-transporter adhesin, head GIN domain